MIVPGLVLISVLLGHILRDDLINPVKMSVREYVRPSVRP